MNFKFFISSLLLIALNATAQTKECLTGHTTEPEEHLMLAITTTTAPPLTLTTFIFCALDERAEVNQVMIQKEASMLLEENKIFVPSFLGTYANKRNMNIREAAQDVLANGIH